MPLLSTAGAASARGYGLFNLQGGYWVGLLGTPATGNSVAVDSAGNAYFCGDSNGIEIVKYNNSGVIQWQRNLSGSFNRTGQGVAIGSTGNVYVSGYSSDGTNYSLQIAKYNTSGVIQFQKKLSSGSYNSYGYSIALDSSENIYVCGFADPTSINTSLLITKYNTSGIIQWQRRLDNSGTNSLGYSVAVDTSGNVYVCGYSDASGITSFQIAKYNTSGTIQWQRSLSSPASPIGRSVAVDTSGNVYVCGTAGGGLQIAKYNTSGTIQWQRSLGGGGGTTNGYSVAVDTSGNVYVCGESSDSGSYDFQIAKYNTSGTIQWQRRLGGSGSDVGRSIAVDSYGTVYVCGIANASSALLFAKLPNDGSRTGTYTVGGYSLTYAASSLTDATTTLTSAPSTLTDIGTGLVEVVTSLTDAATSLTSSVTQI